MARRAAGRFIGWFRPLRGDAQPPLQEQLYRAIRAGVLEGRLRPGERLPSSRALAEDLGLSRNTVTGACDRLVAEGYLAARPASGLFVAEDMPESLGGQVDHGAAASFSRRGQRLIGAGGQRLIGGDGAVGSDPQAGRVFAIGVPALDEFPLETWRRITNRRLRRSERGLLAHGDPQGLLDLRLALADYLREARGLRCGPEHILVVSGAQQALDLVGRVLLDPGDLAALEDPGYAGIRQALLAVGARLAPVPVDAQGLDPALLPKLAAGAKLVAVTPSHQFPLGGTMPLPRRLALLAQARERDFMILEDDYDCEFRYAGPPLPALQGLEQATGDAGRDGGGENGRVIHVGTFSKVLFPGLRLGYLVLPPALLDGFRRVKAIADGHGASLPQAVLADFIAEGHLAQHARRMRKLYRQRQQALLAALQESCGDSLTVGPAEAGLHLVAQFRDGRDDRAAAEACEAAGLAPSPLSRYCIEHKMSGLLLSYAAWPPEALAAAARKLAKILAKP